MPGALSGQSAGKGRSLNNVLVFAERILPSTQTFIPLQINELRRYTARYAGLLPPPARSYPLAEPPVLMTEDRSLPSRMYRELYRWTGISPRFHARVAQLAPDVIHAHFAEGGPAALSLSQALNRPLLLHLRGGAEMHTPAELRSHLFQWPFLAHRKRLWQRASAFLCVSHFIRDRALRAGFPADKLRVHYTGMHCERFTPNLPVSEKDPTMVIYVGRLVPYKGCDYLLRAMRLVQQRLPAAHLVIIGDGSFRAELEKLNAELGVGASFLGEQTQETIRTWLEKARVFCAPSVTLEDGMSEAFGNVFSEAQSMGVPVVSSRHGGIPETMLEGVTGLLAPERDVEMLAAHLLQFLLDDGFWSHAREEGMRWVRQNFSVQLQTARLEQLYDRAVEQFDPRSFAQLPVAD